MEKLQCGSGVSSRPNVTNCSWTSMLTRDSKRLYMNLNLKREVLKDNSPVFYNDLNALCRMF